MNAPTTIFQNQRVLMVKNLRPGLPERGKIKIGIKGEARKSKGGTEFQPPQKLDHFVVTTLRRGPDGNFVRDEALHRAFGDKPTELPVRLLYNDPWLNFQTSYAAFRGKMRWCSGDGETAQRMVAQGKVAVVDCPCERLDFGYSEPDKCKINGTLSVVVDGAEVIGGVWKLRTTSINTCQGIASSLAMISGMTGGILAGIPLTLTLQPKTATTPEGAMSTVYVVGMEYRGSADQLREIALRQAMADASYGERMRRLEDDARRLLEAPAVGGADLDTVEEFYPEAAKVEHGITVPATASHDPETGEVVDPPAEEVTAGPSGTAMPRRPWIVRDDRGEQQHVASTLKDALRRYSEVKAARADKLAVAVANLDLLHAAAAAAGNRLRSRIENEIEAAESYLEGDDPETGEPAGPPGSAIEAPDSDVGNVVGGEPAGPSGTATGPAS